jgi:hypothetical protein
MLVIVLSLEVGKSLRLRLNPAPQPPTLPPGHSHSLGLGGLMGYGLSCGPYPPAHPKIMLARPRPDLVDAIALLGHMIWVQALSHPPAVS